MNTYLGRLTYPEMMKRMRKFRRKVFICIVIWIVLSVLFPFYAHADSFGFETYDVYLKITEETKEINDLMKQAFKFCSTSPYTILNDYTAPGNAGHVTLFRTAVKTVALVVATLLLMVEFFRKTTNFEWSSRWENILLFIVKVILIKQIIQNADQLIGAIYSVCNYINDTALGVVDKDFLPYGTPKTYTIEIENGFLQHMTEDQSGNIFSKLAKNWYSYWFDVGADAIEIPYTYDISSDAVKTFYPNAVLPANDYVKYSDAARLFPNPTSNINYNATLDMCLFITPYFLIMKIICYVIFVMVMGRVFELSLYTFFAPLPLSTFASDTTDDIAKNFLKNYVASVLQIAVIIVMFVVYFAMNGFFTAAVNGYANTKFVQIICLASLGLGVIKSGTWSRQICGIA